MPLDLRVLRRLAQLRSPLALDIYTWLTCRLSYLREPTNLSWASLQMQSGANRARSDPFRAKLLEKLKVVKNEEPCKRGQGSAREGD